jgi:hypothetical protein
MLLVSMFYEAAPRGVGEGKSYSTLTPTSRGKRRSDQLNQLTGCPIILCFVGSEYNLSPLGKSHNNLVASKTPHSQPLLIRQHVLVHYCTPTGQYVLWRNEIGNRDQGLATRCLNMVRCKGLPSSRVNPVLSTQKQPTSLGFAYARDVLSNAEQMNAVNPNYLPHVENRLRKQSWGKASLPPCQY